jgi:hypothetical protein
MTDEEIIADVPGARELFDWFGYWPSFHDAEVLSICLDRAAASTLVVHTYGGTGEVDATGHHVTEKHVLVSFIFDDVFEIQLEGFNHQNVLSAMAFNKLENGFEVILGGCYGVEGSISTKGLRISFEPGQPSEGVYAKQTQKAVPTA